MKKGRDAYSVDTVLHECRPTKSVPQNVPYASSRCDQTDPGSAILVWRFQASAFIFSCPGLCYFARVALREVILSLSLQISDCGMTYFAPTSNKQWKWMEVCAWESSTWRPCD